MPQSALEMAKDLVMAQITAGQLSSDDMEQALQQTYVSLAELKTREETGGTSTVEMSPAPVDWRKSITKHAVTCLECGAT